MKLMIASDLHGSAGDCQALLEALDREGADRLVLLGDLLYHGPRNDLPGGYAPKTVIDLLNRRRTQLLCVRGNCDTEVDQMVLEFPILAEYGALWADGLTIYAIHGHKDLGAALTTGTLVLSGHTHVPKILEENGIYYANPGSVSIPKEGSAHGYMVLEGGVLTHKALEPGKILEPFTFPK